MTEPGVAAPETAEVAVFRARRRSVLDRIEQAAQRSGRDPASITLVAVSKTVPADRLRAAVAAGLAVLGENRVQEGEAKRPLVPGAGWHLIGPLQANKARRAIAVYDTIQSVDSLDLAMRLGRLGREVLGMGERLPVLLQANVDEDPAKAGFDPRDLHRQLSAILDIDGLRVDGLMTVGLLFDDPEGARPTFRRLQALSAELRTADDRLGGALSMGMSADFEVAIEEGATIVRVGRALFGERPMVEPRPPGPSGSGPG